MFVEQSFLFFNYLQQTLHKVICYQIFNAGSRSALRKLLQHWEKQLDQDPQKMNADPEPWFVPSR